MSYTSKLIIALVVLVASLGILWNMSHTSEVSLYALGTALLLLVIFTAPLWIGIAIVFLALVLFKGMRRGASVLAPSLVQQREKSAAELPLGTVIYWVALASAVYLTVGFFTGWEFIPNPFGKSRVGFGISSGETKALFVLGVSVAVWLWARSAGK